MDGFKTLKRSGVAVSAGDRYAIGTLDDRSRRLCGDGAPSAARSRRFRRRAANGPSPSAARRSRTCRSRAAATWRSRCSPRASRSTPTARPSRIGGGGDPNIMMDGVSAMDTGSNRPLLQMNVESIAEVKVLTSGYQAEYGRSSGVQVTAITKSGTQPLPRLALRRRAQLGLVLELQDQQAEQRSQGGAPRAGLGLSRSAGRSASRAATTSCSSSTPGVRAAHRRQQRRALPHADRARAAGRLLADHRQQRQPLSLHQGSADRPAPAPRPIRRRASGTAASSAGSRQDRLYQPGLNILSLYPLPNIANVPAGQNYNYEITRPEESVLSWQPAVRVDYQPAPEAARDVQVLGLDAARRRPSTAPSRASTTRGCRTPPVVSYTASANYTLTPDDVPRGDLRAQPERAGRVRAGAVGDRRHLLQQRRRHARRPDDAVRQPRRRQPAGSAVPVPGRDGARSGLLRGRRAQRARSPAFWDGTRMAKIPTFQWGGRVAERAAPTLGFPGWLNINSTHDFAISLTKIIGRHTFKTGFYKTHSYKAEQVGNHAFGTINFQQDAVGTNPFDTSFGFANAAIGTFSSFQQAQRYVETASVYRNLDFYVAGQLEGDQPADARLRHALRAPGRAVRHARPGVELPARAVVARRQAPPLYVGRLPRRVPVHRQQPRGRQSAHRPVPRRRQRGRHWHAGAGYRRPPERACCCPAATSRRRPTSSRRSRSGRGSAPPTT